MLDSLDLQRWGISKTHLLPHIGPGKTCETFQDLEEFLHKVDAAIASIEQGGKKMRSRAGFLISRLQGQPIGVPDSYVSLREKRLLAEKEAKERELQRIRTAKREKYQVEFQLFQETFDGERKNQLLQNIREEEQRNHPSFASAETLERSVQSRFKDALRKLFCEQYQPEEERGEVEGMLFSTSS
jgi:hypothetical protein